jgi:type IV pilus assembly protein PilP
MVIHGTTAVVLGVAVLISVKTADADSGVLLAQMSPMRQDSITKMSSPPDIPGTPIADAPASPSGSIAQASSQLPPVNGVVGASYDPAGRRDPFAPIIQEFQPGKIDESLPPLQRVALTEINLIAIVWGTYGYIAMVQTPEGHGYTVKRGTKIGQNNGVVSAVTERGIIVEERFTDVYGQKQERESVKLLHPKEGSE